jgi:hypothetical protein
MNPTDTSRCPLCDRPNDCQLCTPNAYKGPCWCARVEIPEALLARVPMERRNQTCICQECVMEFHRAKQGATASQQALPGEFYIEGGLMVFTAEYHRRRGYCCGNNCRHCPYPKFISSSSA